VHPARPHSQELKLISGVATRRGKGEKAVDIAQGGRQGINLYMYLESGSLHGLVLFIFHDEPSLLSLLADLSK
jgi:hypothetical protein